MKEGEYYIAFSQAKDGWCVYVYSGKPQDRGLKQAGPYADRREAETERDRLNERLS